MLEKDASEVLYDIEGLLAPSRKTVLTADAIVSLNLNGLILKKNLPKKC